MRCTLGLAFGLVALAAAPVLAADLPARIPAKAPMVAAPVAYNWSGCYIGGNAGGAWLRASDTFNNGAGIVEGFNYDPSSFIGGGLAGCQMQVGGNWVVGIEGTYSWLDLNQTATSVLAPPRTRTVGLDRMWTVVGKVGYTFNQWMIYAKGGFADARIDTFAINPATGVFGDSRQWQGGWTVGGGIDYMVVPGLVLGAEFNYSRFQFDRSVPANDGTIGVYSNARAEVYSAMGRASWLFNLGGGPVVARY